ncbi:hypothetical protein KKG31_08440 [Patescibacteria group bacterium]|nr:hypothetical protein [Patescibacteria group bacterium]
MAITSASSRRTSSKSVNKFEGQENVINLALDKKLELQLKTKAMLDDLQADAKKSSFFKEKYNELLDAGKNNTIADLRILEKDINTQYDTIKGTGEALKISKMIDDKLKKLAAKEPIDDFAERYFDNRVINNTGKYSNIEDLETAFNNNFRDVA